MLDLDACLARVTWIALGRYGRLASTVDVVHIRKLSGYVPRHILGLPVTKIHLGKHC